jgi:hypothetical protein
MGQDIQERGEGMDGRAGGGLSKEAHWRSGIRRERVVGAPDPGEEGDGRERAGEDSAVAWITFEPNGSNLLYLVVFQVIHMAHLVTF